MSCYRAISVRTKRARIMSFAQASNLRRARFVCDLPFNTSSTTAQQRSQVVHVACYSPPCKALFTKRYSRFCVFTLFFFLLSLLSFSLPSHRGTGRRRHCKLLTFILSRSHCVQGDIVLHRCAASLFCWFKAERSCTHMRGYCRHFYICRGFIVMRPIFCSYTLIFSDNLFLLLSYCMLSALNCDLWWELWLT